MFDRDKDGFIDTDEFKTVTPMKMKSTFINLHRPCFGMFGSLLGINRVFS